MNGLWAAMRAEWGRLARPRRMLGLPVAALLAAGYAWAVGAAAEGGFLGSHSGFYVAAASASGVAITCALVGALAAASAVAGDLAGGVARTALCRPVSRASWIAARIVTLCAAMALLFVFAALGALAAGAGRYGLPAAMDGDFEIASAGFLARQLVVAAVLSLCAQWCAVAFGALLGSLLGRVGAAVVGVALGGAGLTALSRWHTAEPFLPVSPLTSALDRVAQLSQGIASSYAGDGASKVVAACAVWAVGAAALAAVALQRRDILT